MNKCYRFVATFVVIFLISLHAYSQCLLLPTSVEQRVSKAELIIEGKVISQNSFWGEGRRMIYTANEIEVYSLLGGSFESQIIEVITTGGSVEEMTIKANPSLELKIGEEGVFFLMQYQGEYIDNSKEVIWVGVEESASFIKKDLFGQKSFDVFEGVFESQENLFQTLESFTSQRRKIIQERGVVPNLRNNLMPSITNVSPLTVTAGTETLITISGSGFGASQGNVFFRNGNSTSSNSYSSFSTTYIQTWSDTQITMWVPSGAGTGSVIVTDNTNNSPASMQTLTVEYNISNLVTTAGPVRTFMIDDQCDGDGGYRFVYSTSTANGGVNFATEDSGNAAAAFERAISTWQGNGFAVYAGDGCGTTSTQLPENDGENIVAFDNSTWDLGIQSGSTTLGVAYSQYRGCGGTGGVSERELVGIDIIFKRDGRPNGLGGIVNWEYGGVIGNTTPSALESDFESVALHEIGHTHQLGHVSSASEVMYPSITQGTFNRTLGSSEVNGSNDVEAVSVAYSPIVFGGGCGGDFSCSRQYTIFNATENCALVATPVELLSFNGQLQNKSVQLEWQTQTEINNDYFLIEKSINGRSFEKIGTVEGAGNSEVILSYELWDPNPSVGLNYYRLTQFDLDGTSTVVDKIVAVEYNGKDLIALQPNPVSGNQIQLIYAAQSRGDLVVEIYSITGQLLRTLNFNVESERNVFDISLGELSSDVYLLKTQQQGRVESLRFVKTE